MLQANPLVVLVFFCISTIFLSINLLTGMYEGDSFIINARADSGSPQSEAGQPSGQFPSDELRDLGRIRFSKTGENILFLIPDAATGVIFSEILKEHTSLLDDLDGFTFYPNAISSGSGTVQNTAALIAGHRFTPLAINKNPGETLEQIIVDAYQRMIGQLKKGQYDITLINPSFVSCKSLDIEREDRCLTIDEPKYRNALYRHNGLPHAFGFDERLLYTFSVFKSMPHSLKPTLYTSKYWYNSDWWRQDTQAMTWRKYYGYLYLKSLKQLSYVDADNHSPQFIHLWTQDIHHPFALGEDCTPPRSKTFDPYGDEEWKIVSLCYLKAVTEWFHWMKQEGVYDNTKIIIVSDHGNKQYEVNPLMMMKDFDSRGPLKRSQTMMSNADASALICSAFQGCEGGVSDPTRQSARDRRLSYSTMKWVRWEIRKNWTSFKIRKTRVFTQDDVEQPRWQESMQE